MLRHRLILLVALLALVACGGSPAANAAPTRDLVAPTATPIVAATQTRAAELSQIATLTAPTPTARPASPTTAAAALTKGSLVGRVENSDAFIGIVVTGTDVTAYVCDGKSLAQWFTGTVRGDQIDLSAANGARLTADVQRPAGGTELRAAAGTFRSADGKSLAFSSNATDNLGKAGLYRGTGASGSTSLTMGVIVLPNGDLRGALWAGQTLLPVANPTFATNGLTATFEGIGTVAAQRLGT